MEAINTQALRILRLFGDTETTRVSPTVGAEQEYFIIDRGMYEKRKDIKYTGRTLFGAPAPKGQELEDHYFGPLRPRIAAFMAELDEELWKLGINSKTKHNEAAPAQHELAPIFCTTNMAVDQNLLIMEYAKKVAERHGLICLLHEKPFEGVNGSGKHNNWSLNTDTGKNLLDPGKTPHENAKFLLLLAAVVKAADDYQDLLRVSVAHAGNDHRLGANEAPPAIVSMFVGEDLEDLIYSIIDGRDYTEHGKTTMDLGIPSVPPLRKDTTDRNRTSPFAFTGNKFEFRMVGSSQNIAMPNVVLNTAVAESFRQFADRLERVDAASFDSAVAELIKETFTAHKRIIFDGNGYSEEWEREAEARGLLNLKSCVDAYCTLTDKKNITLFKTHSVMNETELCSREEIFFENYSKTINIEALTMVEMVRRSIVPAVSLYIAKLSESVVSRKAAFGKVGSDAEDDIVVKLSALNDNAYKASGELEKAVCVASMKHEGKEMAFEYNRVILPIMEKLRAYVDGMEKLTSSDFWPLPTYGDLMFTV